MEGTRNAASSQRSELEDAGATLCLRLSGRRLRRIKWEPGLLGFGPEDIVGGSGSDQKNSHREPRSWRARQRRD